MSTEKRETVVCGICGYAEDQHPQIPPGPPDPPGRPGSLHPYRPVSTATLVDQRDAFRRDAARYRQALDLAYDIVVRGLGGS